MKTYTYDDAGNMETVTSGGQTVAGYTYTPAGLLATAEYKDKLGNTRTLTNTWDASSNRVRFSIDDGQDPPPCNYYEFVYDPTAGIPAVLQEKECAPGTTYYIREPGGGLIARSTPGGIHYYHFDELGSTRLLTNSSGAVTDRYAYDAYGSVLSHEATEYPLRQPYQYVGQLGYYTHYMEPDFGLLQLGVRFYDAEVGRFTQRDPAGSDLNHYGYVGGSPIRFVDSWGLKRIDVSTDDVLNRCLDGLRNCLPKAIGCAIDEVSNWYTDDNDPKADAYTEWKWKKGRWIIDHLVPSIIFNPTPGQSWDGRIKTPARVHEFCKTVLHELMHVSHGAAGTAWDNLKECANPNAIDDKAGDLYLDNFKCIDQHLRKPEGPILGVN